MAPRLGAIGLGVKDMATSVKFYTEQLGMKPTQTFDVEHFTETVMGYPHKRAGPPILLMQYKNEPAPKNQLGKLVFYVDNVKKVRDKLVAYGCPIFLELGEAKGWASGIFMCRDPDGFVLEFMPLSMLKGSGDLGSKL